MSCSGSAGTGAPAGAGPQFPRFVQDAVLLEDFRGHLQEIFRQAHQACDEMADPVAGNIAAAMGRGDEDKTLDRRHRLHEQGAFEEVEIFGAEFQLIGRLAEGRVPEQFAKADRIITSVAKGVPGRFSGGHPPTGCNSRSR